jgi:predicted NBD/HSP70 family sugar kinase
MRSPAELRQNLAQAVLHVRSQRATSRRTLADVMKLSPTTAGFYVDQLIESGYLREAGLEHGPMGRPKRALGPNASAGWFAGMEFNAERIQAVRIDFSGQMAASEVRSLPGTAGTSEVMAEIKSLITAMIRGATGPLLGIGIGAPGIVDPQRGIGLECAIIPDWRDVPVADQLRKRFKVPVTVENNLRTIALAERWFGGIQCQENYVILGPRSGFGIAIVQHGQLYCGSHHAAGEIGWWPWPFGGEVTAVHDSLSSVAAWRRLSGASTRSRLPANLHDAFSNLEDADSAERESLVKDYAHVIACLHLLLDSEAYYLHGPLTALGTRFCNEITAAIARLVPVLANRPPNLLPSKLGDDAGAMGAACLSMERWQPALDR